jgi:hypothetical protein
LRARAVFTGLARNCEPHLPAVLSNLEQLAAVFEQTAYVIVENDSSDRTKDILSSWGRKRGNFHLFCLDGLGRQPVKTLRLEVARNVYIEYLRSSPTLADFDYLCVLDMDDSGTRPVPMESFTAALEYLSKHDHAGGVFANQLGTYYDMWALRHPQWCPGDIWFEVLEYAQRHRATDQRAFEATFTPRLRTIPTTDEPIEVRSAFGGLGIYRLAPVLRNKNPYLGSRVRILAGAAGEPLIIRMQTCEHVHFNEGLLAQGLSLFIVPPLVNRETTQLGFPPSAFRGLTF